MQKSFLTACMALTLCLLPLQAVPITGTLDFSGGATLDTLSVNTATKVTAWSNVVVAANGVTAGSVLDSTINPGDTVAMTAPWTFASPLNALWNVGGFTFDLLTTNTVLQAGGFLIIKGTGNISGNGYDLTPGDWYFSTQGGNKVDNSNFSFSATTDGAKGVADTGNTLMMLGGALTGMGLVTQYRRKSKQVA